MHRGCDHIACIGTMLWLMVPTSAHHLLEQKRNGWATSHLLRCFVLGFLCTNGRWLFAGTCSHTLLRSTRFAVLPTTSGRHGACQQNQQHRSMRSESSEPDRMTLRANACHDLRYVVHMTCLKHLVLSMVGASAAGGHFGRATKHGKRRLRIKTHQVISHDAYKTKQALCNVPAYCRLTCSRRHVLPLLHLRSVSGYRSCLRLVAWGCLGHLM